MRQNSSLFLSQLRYSVPGKILRDNSYHASRECSALVQRSGNTRKTRTIRLFCVQRFWLVNKEWNKLGNFNRAYVFWHFRSVFFPVSFLLFWLSVVSSARLTVTYFWMMMMIMMMIYLLTAIWLTHGGSNTVHIYIQAIHRTTH